MKLLAKSKKMCDPNCIYCYYKNSNEYELDENGVKYGVGDNVCICDYDGSTITKWKKCENRKERND